MAIFETLAASGYGDFVAAGIILAISLSVAFLIHSLMNFYLFSIAKKTGTKFDDAIFSALKKPMYVLALVTGAYFSLLQLNLLASHSELIGRIYNAAIIIILAYAVTKIVSALLAWQLEKQTSEEAKSSRHIFPFAKRAVTVFIYAVAMVALLDQMNIKVTALVASVGVASLAVALALQDTLANFFAGVYIMADRPVRIGDYVRLENGEEGYVAEIGWRSTKIKTLSDNLIVMPNSKLSQSIITNYYLPNEESGVFVKIGVSYESDLGEVEKLALSAAREVQKSVAGASKNHEPVVRFSEFGPANVIFNVVMRVDDPQAKFLITHELMKHIAKKFRSANIKMK